MKLDPSRNTVRSLLNLGALSVLVGAGGAAALSGCGAAKNGDSEAVIGHGTLGVSPDGRFSAAAYPESGKIEIFDLNKNALSKTASLDRAALLGRMTLSNDAAFVVDEREGSLLKIDLSSGNVETEAAVCEEPRGTTLSEDGASLYVACADGELVSLATKDLNETRRLKLAPDLRDVQVFEEGLVVSRFRKGEILVLDAEGEVTETWHPDDDEDLGQAGVAWRMIVDQGQIYLLYQFMSEQALGGGPGVYYGNGCSFQVVRPVVGRIKRSDDGELVQEGSVALNGAAGAVDLAVRDGVVAVAVPGNAWAPRERASLIVWNDGVGTGDYDDLSACDSGGGYFGGGAAAEPTEREAPIAVAMSLQGRVITQSSGGGLRQDRDQTLIDGDHSASSSRGQRMFHMSTDLGIACVSCHPDGGDDGHIWSFAESGLRRSQNLRGGLSDRKVFHWSGDLPNVDALMKEVFVGRMGLSSPPTQSEQADMVAYLDSLPGESHAPSLSADATSRGEALFLEAGCSDCHAGPRYTNGKIYDVGTGGKFVTPSLLGVHVRAPYLHDGCAEDLHARFGACGGGDKHGQTSQLSDREVDDLVAFLESL